MGGANLTNHFICRYKFKWIHSPYLLSYLYVLAASYPTQTSIPHNSIHGITYPEDPLLTSHKAQLKSPRTTTIQSRFHPNDLPHPFQYQTDQVLCRRCDLPYRQSSSALCKKRAAVAR